MNPTHATAPEAWQLYRRRGQISPELLRPHVYRAWERAHQERASPLHAQAERISPIELDRLLERKNDLIIAARPYMLALSAAAGQERHAAMLGDEAAVVLDVRADPTTSESLGSFPGPGSVLQESLSGANGIGTPLVESGYAELVGPEHFIQGFHTYTCQGVPIRGPGDEVVGVLSTSVRRVEASQRLRNIMLVAAKGISAELMIRHLERMMHKVVQHGELSNSMVEKLRQDLIQIYAAGRMKVEIAAMQLGKAMNVSPFEDGMQLLAAAAGAMERFREQSTLCLGLASSDSAMKTKVILKQVIANILDLLVTETRIKKVKFVTMDVEDIVVYTDPRGLEKCLLRLLLNTLEAGAGHSISTEVRSRPWDRKGREIVFTSLWESTEELLAGKFQAILRFDENGQILRQTK